MFALTAITAREGANGYGVDLCRALITLHGTFGHIAAVSVSAMLNAFRECELFEDALRLFWTLRADGFEADAFCIHTALHCAGDLVSLQRGLAVAAACDIDVEECGDAVIASALISLFAKCARFERAVALWTQFEHRALSAQRAEHRFLCCAALDCFAKMGDADRAWRCFVWFLAQSECALDVHRDAVALCIVLRASAHCGDARLAMEVVREIESSAREMAEMEPEVLSAMVDCFARMGHLNTAEHLFHRFCPSRAQHSQSECAVPRKIQRHILNALLSASRIHGDTERERRIANLIREEN